ncbi:MAG TPA: tripartite tricarboxylate transporter permease [Candidatus Limnocylindria bacterium]
MEALGELARGFAVALDPFVMAMLTVGVLAGLIIGILPGLGGTSGVAILLPLSVFVAVTSKTAAIAMLAGIYWGAVFGGVVTSILFNIPGEPWSVALLFDGFPMAKRLGKPGLALTLAFTSSLFGAIVSSILFTFFALPLAELALRFGPAELFAVFMMAFATLVGLESGSPLKSIAMIGFGLLLAAVGFDSLTGEPRLTFGQIGLLSGIGFIPVTIGLFGLGEILASAEEAGVKYEQVAAKLGLQDLFDSIGELRRKAWMLVANTLIGFWIGVLPGTGATPASFLSYGIARQYAPDKEKANFGKGEPAGIFAPQASANAASVGSLLPMITLGVPGSPTAAVIMAGLFVWGLTPGPLLFTEQRDFVWGLIASIYIGNFMAFAICLLATPLLASIMRAPYSIITPFIILASIIGAYSVNNAMKDVFIVLIFGVIGYWLRKMKYPLAPLVVAIVLGDSTERELRKALIGSGGDPRVLIGINEFGFSPFAAILSAVAIALFLLPLVQYLLRRRSRGSAAATAGEPAG